MNEGGSLLEDEKEEQRFYRFSLWWVNHRAGLKRLGLGLFIAFDAVLLLFAGWHLMDAFAISYNAEQQAVARVVALGQADLHAYTSSESAVDLEQKDVRVISTGNKLYDFYTTIRNPNEDWWAEFSYGFTYGQEETVVAHGFILPGEEKPLVGFAIESDSPIPSADLVVTDMVWHRVDHHAISDYLTWSQDRLDLSVSETQFTPETRFDGEVFGRSTFNLKNDTAYSYYDLGLFVVLKRGASVVGINRTTLSTLNSGDDLEVTVNWFGTLPSVTQVEVIPELNIFDLGVYKPLQGESTLDTRTRVFR